MMTHNQVSPSGWRFAAGASLGLGMLLSSFEAAACSRKMTVAISPVGRSMVVGADDKVTGAVAEFLDKVSASTTCKFDYRIVPRARALMLLAAGEIDIVPAASQSADRDRHAKLIPTHRVRLSAVSFDATLPALRTTNAVRYQQLHIGVVRAYDFGPRYASLLEQLKRNGKLHEVADPAGLVGLLNAGRIHAALIPLTAVADAVEDARMGARLRAWTLDDVAPSTIGFYLSSKAIGDADQSELQAVLKNAIASGTFKQLMQKHYPQWSLSGVVFE